MSVVISIINNKGGVAKTTSVFTLGAYFASLGKNVLLLDLDAQLSLTEKAEKSDHSEKSIVNDYDIVDFLNANNKILKFYTDTSGHLYTMRGSKGINEFLTINKNSEPEKYHAKRLLFQRQIKLIKNKFDIILIDCAPGMFDEHLLTPNEVVLLGTDYVLTPITADNDSITGILKVTEAIKRIKPDNPGMEYLGAFFTNVRTEEKIYIGFESMLNKMIGGLLFNTPIRRSTEMQQALSLNTTIFDYRPNSIASKDYAALGEEILQKISNFNK